MTTKTLLNGHFNGQPGSLVTEGLHSGFYWSGRTMDVVVSTGAISQTVTINIPTPNQQCQSTEGKKSCDTDLLTVSKLTWVFQSSL